MASIIKTIPLTADADAVWSLLRDVGAAHRAFPGVLTACVLEGDRRTVTFANGAVVHERIVSVDDAERRVAYGVIEGRFSHHSAALQVQPTGPQTCQVIWSSDFLPDEAEAVVRPLVEAGAAALQGAVVRRP